MLLMFRCLLFGGTLAASDRCIISSRVLNVDMIENGFAKRVSERERWHVPRDLFSYFAQTIIKQFLSVANIPDINETSLNIIHFDAKYNCSCTKRPTR